MPHPFVNVERDQLVADLTRDGLTASEISQKVGITERSVVRARRRTGTSMPHRIPFTEEECLRAELMLEDGMSYAEAARTLGRSEDYFRKKFRGMSRCTPSETQVVRKAQLALEGLTWKRRNW